MTQAGLVPQNKLNGSLFVEDWFSGSVYILEFIAPSCSQALILLKCFQL